MSRFAQNCLFFTCFAIVTSLFGKILLHLDINKRTYNHVPGECGVIPNLPGILSVATTTGGRLYMTVSPKENTNGDTHLFTFYSDNRTAREIVLRGTPKKFRLKASALSVTDSLNPDVFVFNEKTLEVEVFETNEHGDVWKYLRTMTNEHFEGLDDLAAAGPQSFYFVKNSIFGSAFNFIERLVPLPTGQLLFANKQGTRHVMHISSPTGVVFDSLKKTIFVTSFTRNSIYVAKMKRGSEIDHIKEYDIGCSPSSIWKDFDGSFLVTCHQIRFRYLLNYSKVILSSPSMVLRVVIPRNEDKKIAITQLYSNDGATISRANIAAVTHQKSQNILCWWNTWFSTRMEIIPFLIPWLKFIEALRPGSLTFLKDLNTFFFHLQVCSALSMFLYRLGRLECPFHFKNYQKLYFALYFLCSVAYSGLLLLPCYGEAIQVSLNNGTLTKVIALQGSKKSMWFISISSGVYMFLFFVLGLAPRFKLLVSTDVSSPALRERDKELRSILGSLTYVYCSVYTGIVVWSVLNLIQLYHPFLPVWILQHNNLFLTTVSDIVNY
ncbi:unnamed protein product [Caenorhabditis sp. 36 PRJEB53466]|nr:unnamed protein product [Caenorhabditis sp. 36 PRJEB53466]